MKSLKLNTVVCAIFITISALYFYVAMGLKYWSSQYAPGPGFIPRWVGGMMLVLSIIAFFQSFRQEGITLKQALPENRNYRINLYVCWGGLIFYLVMVKKLGFVITASVLMIALFSRGTTWKRAIPLGIIVSLVCFFIFKVLLQVQVPTNHFGW